MKIAQPKCFRAQGDKRYSICSYIKQRKPTSESLEQTNVMVFLLNCPESITKIAADQFSGCWQIDESFYNFAFPILARKNIYNLTYSCDFSNCISPNATHTCLQMADLQETYTALEYKMKASEFSAFAAVILREFRTSSHRSKWPRCSISSSGVKAMATTDLQIVKL